MDLSRGGQRLVLGLLRLSTEGRPERSEAMALIHHALNSGVRWLDTADSYGLDHRDMHYGERLASEAVATWDGPRDEVRILTKVGLTRPKGKWVPDGSRKHVLQSVERSLEALRTSQLFCLQLHVKDSRVPFEETLGVLHELQALGKVLHVGMCNVEPYEVRQASRHFRIASVQNELSLLSRGSAADGMLAWTARSEIPFLAYRVLGGTAKVGKWETHRTIGPWAKQRNVPATALAIAAIARLGTHVYPVIGATRMESLRASLEAMRFAGDEELWGLVQSKFSMEAEAGAIQAIEGPGVAEKTEGTSVVKLEEGLGPGSTPEVVLLMGIQGAGKSELVREYEASGYERLNRDALGGSLEGMVVRLRERVRAGVTRVVLDNTYPTRVSRAPVIDAAREVGLPVRCRWLMTSPSEAKVNIATRLLERYGRLLGPDEMKRMGKEDSNLPPPVALQRWSESFEEPELDEGFAVVDRIPFVRRVDANRTGLGLFLDVDGTLRRTLSGEKYPRSVEDIEILPGRSEVLGRWVADGYQLFFVSNQSGVASGKVEETAVKACFERTVELLGLSVVEVAYCPHSAFPVGCFCRKPLPGLGVYLGRKYGVDLSRSIMVGDLESDRQFADGLGMRYIEAGDFFGADAR